MLFSDFPCEPDQAELLLIDLGVTHLLSLSPATKITAPVQHRRDIDVVGRSADELLLVLPEACEFIQQATEAGGKVLVHSTLETRACTVVAAYRELFLSYRLKCN
jgi:dual specificity phosphatase 12